MNKSNLILLFLAIFFLSNCEKPFKYEQATIEAVSFDGIPDSDVAIDAGNRIITVSVPPILNGGLRPVFKLSKDAQVFDGLTSEKTVDMTPFCSCIQSNEPKEAIIRVSNSTSLTVYKLRVKANGELKALPSTEKISFSRQTEHLVMILPVENLYSNPKITEFEFTNLDTGQVVLLNTDEVCVMQCKADRLNQLTFDLFYPAKMNPVNSLNPGIYSIRLGSLPKLISFPEKLIVTN